MSYLESAFTQLDINIKGCDILDCMQQERAQG